MGIFVKASRRLEVSPSSDPPGVPPPQFTGQHPLRERAKKIDQGILVIRFEVMFDIWCEKCGELIATGRRFNAEKQSIGEYHSTKIWQFKFRHHCGCSIVIQSDPKNTQYIVVEGARKKVETYDAAAAGTWEVPDEQDKVKASDPFHKLEHGEGNRERRAKRLGGVARLEAIKELNAAKHGDNYDVNKRLRAQLRASKKEAAAQQAEQKAVGLHQSVKLLPAAEADAQHAALTFYADDSKYQGNWQNKRRRIMGESIFSSTPQQTGQRSTSSSSRGPVVPHRAAGLASRSRGQQHTIAGKAARLQHLWRS